MIVSEIERPLFQYRDFTSEQSLDAAERILATLLHPKMGLPADQALILEIVQDAARDASDLAARLGMERKSQFTRDKLRAHQQRGKCLVALRRGAKHILRDPDEAVVAVQAPGAQRVLDLMAKYRPELSSDSQAETTTSVRLLIVESENTGLPEALQGSDLLRVYRLLKEAQETYVKLVQLEDSELGEEGNRWSGERSGPDAAPRLMREIKDSLAGHFRLAFEIMAYLAAKGIEPYARLLAQCREITSGINSVVKLRDTLAKKAEAKQGTATGLNEEAKTSLRAAAGSSEGADPAKDSAASASTVPSNGMQVGLPG